MLHVILFAQPSRHQLLRTATQYWLADKAVNVPHTTTLRGRSIHIDVDPPARWQADGDPQGMSPVDITLRPGALRVIVPNDG